MAQSLLARRVQEGVERRGQVAVESAHVGLVEEVDGEIAPEDPKAHEPDRRLVVPEARIPEKDEPDDDPECQPRGQPARWVPAGGRLL